MCNKGIERSTENALVNDFKQIWFAVCCLACFALSLHFICMSGGKGWWHQPIQELLAGNTNRTSVVALHFQA